jgi:hypothetical protein
MDPRPDLEVEFSRLVDDRPGACDCPRGAVEAAEAVACGVDLDTPISAKLATDGTVVLSEQLAPAPVTELAGTFRRAMP